MAKRQQYIQNNSKFRSTPEYWRKCSSREACGANEKGEKVDYTTLAAEITNSTAVMMTTVAGNITVPAATYTRDAVTGEYIAE